MSGPPPITPASGPAPASNKNAPPAIPPERLPAWKRLLRVGRRSPQRTWFGFFLRLAILGTIMGIIAVGAVVFLYSSRAMMVDLDVVEDMPEASLIFDANGTNMGRFFDENRVPMPADKPVPENLKKAIIAKEDRRFYDHWGVDPKGIFRALRDNLTPGGARQGGSTITQQLGRNSIKMMQRTYDRKLLEIFLAFRIEARFSKEEILRHYLDRVYFGQGIFGAETAANAFFNKSVKDLTIGEASLLAGMLSGPNMYSPWNDIKKATGARDRVLGLLVEQGVITDQQRDAAEKESLEKSVRPRRNPGRGYAQDAIRKELEGIVTPSDLDSGGLRIFCSIDSTLQSAAEKAITQNLEQIEGRKKPPAKVNADGTPVPENVLQAAAMSIEPSTGAIRVMVGGRDYADSQFNRALQSKRQIGSTIKPLLYAIAFETRGFSPASWVENTPFNIAQDKYDEENGQLHTYIRADEALGRSDNYAAVRTGHTIGPEALVAYAQKLGVQSPIAPVPSSYLGACGLSLQEVMGIYTTMASGGVYRKPYLVVQVQNSDGAVVYQHQDDAKQVFRSEVARQVTGMMENGVKYGTGTSLRSVYKFTAPAAGKTGTTNDYKDAWFMGFTTGLATGVWVGYDTPTTIQSEGYGAKLALPVWAKVMTAANPSYGAKPFPVPPGVQAATIGGGEFGQWRSQLVYLTPDQAAAEAPVANNGLPEMDPTGGTDNYYEPQPQRRRAPSTRSKNWWERIFE